MKAKVKATGEIVDVVYEKYTENSCGGTFIYTDGTFDYTQQDLEFDFPPKGSIIIKDDIPSEQRMRYELTKAAMQGLVKDTNSYDDKVIKYIVKTSINIANETIKQLKENNYV